MKIVIALALFAAASAFQSVSVNDPNFKFYGYSVEQWAAEYLMPVDPLETHSNIDFTNAEALLSSTGIDLTEESWSKDCIHPIRDQGSCGSCWAFAAVGEHEAAWAIANGELKTLGEQELVDCSRKQGNHGCSGGWHYYAWDYMKLVGGLEQESDYPYHAKDETCVSVENLHVEPVASYKKISTKTASLQAELDKQPVAVAVDASKWSQYTGGVLTSCGTRLNHAVVAVGYDEAGNWIVRNSWGARWGEQGHIILAPGNTCGILNKAYTTAV